MQFTFGIVTDGFNDQRINLIIDTIESQKIPEYEVIIIGNSSVNRNNCRVIPFDESIKKMWITKKKNLITSNATYDNIVFMHDYIVLLENWYSEYIKFGDKWDICMNCIHNLDGTRFRDWCLFPPWIKEKTNVVGNNCIIPYDITHLTQFQYISGSYWVSKRTFMLKYPLNEILCWGESEDIEWCSRIRHIWKFCINPNSRVKCLKQKHLALDYFTGDHTILSNLRI